VRLALLLALAAGCSDNACFLPGSDGPPCVDNSGGGSSPPEFERYDGPVVAASGDAFQVAFTRTRDDEEPAKVRMMRLGLDPLAPPPAMERVVRFDDRDAGTSPSIASDGQGNTLVAWRDRDGNVRAARLDAAGELLDPEPIAVGLDCDWRPYVVHDGATWIVLEPAVVDRRAPRRGGGARDRGRLGARRRRLRRRRRRHVDRGRRLRP
jgi:hypothetical protein